MEKGVLLESLGEIDLPFIHVKDTENERFLLYKNEGKFVRELVENDWIKNLFKIQTYKLRQKNIANLNRMFGKEPCEEISFCEMLLGKSFYIFHDFLGLTFCIIEFPSKNILIIAGAYQSESSEEIATFKNEEFLKLMKLSKQFPKKNLYFTETIYHALHHQVIHCLFSKNERELMEIVAFLKKDFSIHHSLSELAEKFTLTERTIQRRFQMILNMSFTEFYHILKMQYARKLLMRKHYTIEEISAQTGYGTVSSFLNAFKRFYGYTPR
ncbi:Helix-turn-helix domain-containing protein [Pilibacter termitis]|uniref:Helix-turn-helix domain-containing protein n=1 Tax=Pilibacter termitis TaxID=263852 RepID=A0A1T4LWF7_9ENTE|nr:AraC family transcriptional regulator [Pilibacter termitis]SJZ59022.1 Helix-turn-helix domain-containing protein [Pilibacter termitis]